MRLTKGFVCAVLFTLACGPVEINERQRPVSFSADGEAEKTNERKQEDNTTNQPNTPNPPADVPTEVVIPDSTLLWDGVELQATSDLLIVEME